MNTKCPPHLPGVCGCPGLTGTKRRTGGRGCRLRRWTAAFAVYATALAPTAWAVEPTPDYGPVVQVHEFLIAGHQPGDHVAILGFPLCSELDECRLLAGREYVSPRIPFSATTLGKVDQERLLHCRDPERGAKPCITVLYGEVVRGRGVMPQRIEWRAYD